jgi:hypothetical protein
LPRTFGTFASGWKTLALSEFRGTAHSPIWATIRNRPTDLFQRIKKRDRAAEGEEREEYPAPVFLLFYSLLFFCQQKISHKVQYFSAAIFGPLRPPFFRSRIPSSATTH